ncbi:MAG: tRNA epoxyqueuosine(34) reductase QueG [bacterium]|nr:tRNA epoxyqueuosine(34) reductase QueG [bacterium]
MWEVRIPATTLERLALDCGFELAGVAAAEPVRETGYFRDWLDRGMAGEMSYLAGHRADVRMDPKRLLASAKSILSVGKLYNSPRPYSTELPDSHLGWISRYAWGDDYHDILRRGLERLDRKLGELAGAGYESRICVDTAPLLERSYARLAGLGWIGKNTCLINQQQGSWFFLGELLTSLELDPGTPPPDRCGACTRCIDACPTDAIVPSCRAEGPAWMLDSRLCISYFTIELRGPIPQEHRSGIGHHIFGCDICQDVCPWNRKAPVTDDQALAPVNDSPPLDRMAALTADEFRELFRRTPLWRTKYRGFLRNVAVAMGNSGEPRFVEPLEKLARHPDPLVAEHAEWALLRLAGGPGGRGAGAG